MIFTKERVLVCDDQPMLRRLLSSAIAEHSPHVEITEVENGAIAEAMASVGEYLAIFLDVEMPVQDGFTTLKHLREKNLPKNTKVVMCTGCSEESDLVRGWQLRADYYLTKPFDLDELGEILDSIRSLSAPSELAC